MAGESRSGLQVMSSSRALARSHCASNLARFEPLGNEPGASQHFGLRMVRPLSFANSYVVLCRRETEPEERVVLKMIPRDSSDGSFGYDTRFNKEVNLLQRMNHPNILKMVNFATFPSYHATILPYCPGGTLSSRLGDPRIAALGEITRIFVDIANAVHYIHGKHILHRDIKPSNILIGSNDQAILSDFDRATAMTEGETHVSGRVGTHIYYAPEVSRVPQSPYNGYRVDTYALGLVLLTMLRLKRPSPGEDIWSRVVSVRFKRQSHAAKCLKTLLRGLLDPCPEMRCDIFQVIDFLKLNTVELAMEVSRGA